MSPPPTGEFEHAVAACGAMIAVISPAFLAAPRWGLSAAHQRCRKAKGEKAEAERA